jgi:hypothetical protein
MDRRLAMALRKREAAEAHAASLRDRCSRNAQLINLEEIAAADSGNTGRSRLALPSRYAGLLHAGLLHGWVAWLRVGS